MSRDNSNTPVAAAFDQSIGIGADLTTLTDWTINPFLLATDPAFYSTSGTDGSEVLGTAASAQFSFTTMPAPPVVTTENVSAGVDQALAASSPVTGSGASAENSVLGITVADGAVVEIAGASGQSVTFASTTGTLKLQR